MRYHHEDDLFVYSASDVTRFKGCAKANALEIEVAMRRRTAPDRPPADVYARAGIRFENQVLQDLIAEYGSSEVVIIDRPGPYAEDIKLAAKATLDAMSAGAAVVHQATLWQDISDQTAFLGYADFLMRQGDGSYQVVDTKIAKEVKEKYLVQIGLYARTLQTMTGVPAVDPAVHLGTGEIREIPLERALDAATDLEERFLEELAPRRPMLLTLPRGRLCDECTYCRWKPQCTQEWQQEDALTLISGIGPEAMAVYESLGISTGAQLGAENEEVPKGEHPANAWRRNVLQARLQHQAKTSSNIPYLILEREYLARLRPPQPGDLYFDIEGYAIPPYQLEYLFGLWGGETFTAMWAHSKDEEQAMLDRFVGFVQDQMKIYPDLRIYFFNHYEPSSLRRIAAGGPHEDLIDQWCSKVLVDLRPFVVRCLMAGLPGYGLKELEKLYGFTRTADLKTATGSIELYDNWLYGGRSEPALLEQIAAYNLEDLVSTQGLHAWLSAQ